MKISHLNEGGWEGSVYHGSGRNHSEFLEPEAGVL